MKRTPYGLVVWITLYTLLVVVAAGWSVQRQRQHAVADLEGQLHERSIWAMSWLAAQSDLSPDELQRQLEYLTDKIDPLTTAVRVAVVDQRGIVLADSAVLDARGTSVRDQPDVLAALARGSGMTQTMDPGWTVARVVPLEGAARIIVRVTLPGTVIRQQLRERTRPMLLGIALIWAAGGLLWGWRARCADRAQSERNAGPSTLHVSRDPLSSAAAALQPLVDGIAEGMLVVDADDRLLLCNAAALRLISDEPVIWAQRHVWEVVRWPDFRVLIAAARGATTAVEQEIRATTPHGERLLLVRAVSTGTDAPLVVMMVQDVTELRRLERVRRDFVANVSHELKTPIMAILGYLDLLYEDSLHWDPPQREWLHKAIANVQRVEQLVRDLLLLARAEAVPEVPREPCDLGVLAHSTVERWQDAVRDRPLTITCHTPEGGASVLADAASLRQVLDNLLANAARFTAQGTIQVVVTRQERDVELAVHDTGIGIPLREQERIFERFYQVDPARSGVRGGTGLGLAIVKHYVQGLGGRVAVRSTEGVGSVFTVWLPAAGSV